MNQQLEIFTLLKSSPTTATAHTPIDARRISSVYHNTTAKTRADLDQAQLRASGQTEKILRLFRHHPHTLFTPWDVHLHLGQQLMITSIRRAITTLTDAGYLEKTAERRRSGPANETSYTWKLKIITTPKQSL